ncbi:FHF complex subunit HOOK-interacting protein 1B isoform X4 [Phyllobates terribilis]|uniref:FHF complex subunit HOOK-interacting protein 1B isoform X4 n=1 Tax=Phyllobates terribilis TaxID=111132 RepID=UPI003CCB5719
MSWLSKLNPRGSGSKSGRNANLQPQVTADPETCLMVFKNHWSQVLRILERPGSADRVTPDDLSCVRNNTYQQARDALLLIMAMSSDNPTMARYITENSFFCPILATGLSALYSSLPRKIEVRGDDWHFLRREDWIGVSSLVLFMNSLEFCNAVTQVAHPLVQNQLVEYVHNGFLVPVMGPALHKTSIEEMIASTAYLELFLRSISETALLKTFLRFILLHRHDSATILHTLVSRIASNSRLCMVSLTLFRTLLNLNCEDVLLQLVLRYLIPCNHVMLSQRRAVKDLDLYSKTADKFLSLIPKCCRKDSLLSQEREEEHATWTKAQGSPSIDLSSVHTVPRPSTPSRMGFFMRQSTPESPSHRSPVFSPPDPGSPRHGSFSWDEVSELDGNYLEYLQEARAGIDRCTRACRVWSAPYDGEEPSPRSVSPPTPEEVSVSPDYFSPPPSSSRSQDREREARRHIITPRTKKRSLEEGGHRAAAHHDGHSQSSRHGAPVPALMNGAVSEEQGQLGGSQRGAGHLGRTESFEIKKVKREDGAMGRAEGAEQSTAENVPDRGETQRWAATQWDTTDSVDSLIDELLDRAPAETNGAHVSIEVLGEELKKMEDSMRVVAVQEEPADGHRTIPPEDELEGEDHRETDNSKNRADSLTLLLSSPLRAQNGGQPYTGPFIAILFAKLENMLTNSLYVNFLLTGLVAQLACHPQPLLRSFLLNTNMVFQPSVKSLVQVLGSVKNKIEAFAVAQDDFPILLLKAKRFLIARGKLDWGEGQGSVPALRRSDTLVKSRKPSIGELILRHTNSPTRARQAAQMAFQHVRDGQVLHALSGTSIFKTSAEKQNEALRVKNAVYCAVIFTEFMKELAAITQEHAVTSPYLPPDAEE